MIVDVPTSTVTIDDRRFPAVAMICPLAPGQDDPEIERLLGGPARPVEGPNKGIFNYYVFVPCENGVLVQMEWEEDKPNLYTLHLESRTCEITHADPAGPLYLPHTVGIHQGGYLMALSNRIPKKNNIIAWYWDNAEADWVVEFIDRISTLPYTQPEGPVGKLIRLDETEELLRVSHEA